MNLNIKSLFDLEVRSYLTIFNMTSRRTKFKVARKKAFCVCYVHLLELSFLRRDVYWNIFSDVLQLKARVVQFQWVQNLPWPWKKVLPARREGMCYSFITKLVSTMRVILHSLSSGLQIILLLAFSRKLRCFSLITNSGLGVVRVPSCWVFINWLHSLLFAQSKEGIAWGEKHLLWLKIHIVWYEGFLA